MSTTHRHRSRVTADEVAQAYGVSKQQAQQWLNAGAQFSHQNGALAAYSPAYPTPAEIRRK